ncbi:FeoA family protein [Thiohalocapsa sp. ML1]|jgi:ferrous iron transport protein A|uniref:FeoA family protein n=1 Tax=Thiohalocapsa sp. ML1 TaxID=1431688 RepID=UPI00073240E1|nr:FeoA family protein [Thiohalocapsa sp. ML1]
MQRSVAPPLIPQAPAGAEPVALGSLPAGTRARLSAIHGGRQLERKLGALGLRVGGVFRVEHRRGRGLVVASGASRIALGGAIVDKLLVVALADEDMNGTAPAD